ncbi:hypothetical protein [Frondihabitans sucicola]|nr:hypothetical protein [Frondihabitans sucicola]
MSIVAFPTAPRNAAVLPSATPAPAQREARILADLITAEVAAETESRRLRRAAERHRERIVTGITVAACSVAGVTAVGFAQLLLVAR